MCFRFKIAAIVGRRQFPCVESTNKKDGKREAADLALRKLIAEGEYRPQSAPSAVSHTTGAMVAIIWGDKHKESGQDHFSTK